MMIVMLSLPPASSAFCSNCSQTDCAPWLLVNISVISSSLSISVSPSVQTTLFQMGEAALKTAPEISKIALAMPNQHCLLINLAPFGLENKNEVFVPTDEPHGQIEAVIAREQKTKISSAKK